MKYLCVCVGGNVRSRALAYVLHDLMGHEAIPVGTRWMSPETLAMLCGWADVIVVMQPQIAMSIPPQFAGKVECVDVGEDTYGLHIPKNLMDAVSKGARRLVSIPRQTYAKTFRACGGCPDPAGCVRDGCQRIKSAVPG